MTRYRNELSIRYQHGSGALRQAPGATAGFAVAELQVQHDGADGKGPSANGEPVSHPRRGEVQVSLTIEGKGDERLSQLVASLGDIDGVVAVGTGDMAGVGDTP
ncbi:MAG TPA: hypothetical protein VEJ21_00140 [Acidimicrobiales bacterium]|nr:hypothetical protein [Acidimicrobiales bacterium]